MNTEKEAPLFDSTAQYAIALKREGKNVTCAVPNDEQWEERQRKITTEIQQLDGNRGSKTESKGMEAANAELLKKIYVSGDADLDDAQASLVIERLTRADAKEAEASADGYEITLRVLGGFTKHSMRIPMEKELRAYRRAAFCFIDRRHGKQELKSFLPAIGDFYDLTLKSHSGYVAEVPLFHKLAVVAELTHAVDALDAEEDPENF